VRGVGIATIATAGAGTAPVALWPAGLKPEAVDPGSILPHLPDRKLSIEITNDEFKEGEYDRNLYVQGVPMVGATYRPKTLPSFANPRSEPCNNRVWFPFALLPRAGLSVL
jgi:hypothetical protein